MRPFRARMRVDLPQPEGPATSSTSPGAISSETSRSAGSDRRWYRNERPSTTATGSVTPAGSCDQDLDRLVLGQPQVGGGAALVDGDRQPIVGVDVEDGLADRRRRRRCRPRPWPAPPLPSTSTRTPPPGRHRSDGTPRGRPACRPACSCRRCRRRRRVVATPPAIAVAGGMSSADQARRSRRPAPARPRRSPSGQMGGSRGEDVPPVEAGADRVEAVRLAGQLVGGDDPTQPLGGRHEQPVVGADEHVTALGHDGHRPAGGADTGVHDRHVDADRHERQGAPQHEGAVADGVLRDLVADVDDRWRRDRCRG